MGYNALLLANYRSKGAPIGIVSGGPYLTKLCLFGSGPVAIVEAEIHFQFLKACEDNGNDEQGQ